MAINANDYLGVWVDQMADDSTAANIECIKVDTEKMIAEFSNGQRISVIDLDTSGRYVKPRPWFTAPEIAGDIASRGFQKPLSEQAVQSDILGDLSKIGRRKPEESQQFVQRENTAQPQEGVQTAATTDPIPSEIDGDPVAQFIDSAIRISRKTGAHTTIPVTIPLNIDFDIINVIKMSMQIGASDVEILQRILKYIHISIPKVKNLIAQELMEPADAAIVNENREEKFDKTLKEELENNAPEPVIPTIAEHTDKDPEGNEFNEL